MDKIEIVVKIFTFGLIISVGYMGYLIYISEPSLNYKALYEELQYNQTIQDAFNNGTIFGINEAKIQIIEAGSTCEPFSISAFHIPTDQTITMELKWVECV